MYLDNCIRKKIEDIKTKRSKEKGLAHKKVHLAGRPGHWKATQVLRKASSSVRISTKENQNRSSY